MDKNKKVYQIKPEERINDLHLKPTNNTVTVHYANVDKIYDNIHYPVAFAKAIMKTDGDWISISLNNVHWGDNPNHPKNKKQ